MPAGFSNSSPGGEIMINPVRRIRARPGQCRKDRWTAQGRKLLYRQRGRREHNDRAVAGGGSL